jgi:hypothetical protein
LRNRLATLCFVALTAAVGCGPAALSPSPTVPPPTTAPGETTTTITPAAGTARLENCLRAYGLEIPPIPLDAQGRPRLELSLAGVNFGNARNAEAIQACAVHMTTGALGLEGSEVIRTSVIQMLKDYSECVRLRGVPEFPDPVEDFDGVGPPFPADRIPFHDPDLPAAADTCRARVFSS